MKTFLTLVAWLVGIVVSLWLLWTGGGFLLRNWSASLLVIYLFGAVLFAGASALAVASRPGGDISSPFFLPSRFNQWRWRDAGIATRLQILASAPFRIVSVGLSWLVVFISTMRRITISSSSPLANISNVGAMGLRPVDVWIAFWSLAALVILNAVQILTEFEPNHAVTFVALILVGTTSRHVNYAIGQQSIAKQLRRSEHSPFPMFVWLSLLDGCTLILVWATLKDWSLGEGIRLQTIPEQASLLFNPGDWKDVVSSGQFPTMDQLITFIPGLVFGSAILSTLLQYKHFHRQPEDLIGLAQLNMLTGKFAKAADWLDKVDDRSTSWFLNHSLCMLGVNQVEDSLGSMRRYVEDRNSSAEEQDVLFTLLNHGLMMPLPRQVVLDILERFPAAGMSLARAWTIVATVQAVQRLTPMELRSAFREDGMLYQSYPAIAAYLMSAEDRDGAATALELARAAIGEDSSPFERALPDLLGLSLVITPDSDLEDDHVHLSEFLANKWPEIKLVAINAREDASRFALIALITQLQSLVALLEPDRLEEMSFLVKQITDKLTDPNLVSEAQNIIRASARSRAKLKA